MVNFREFLPKYMLKSPWASFIDVYQSISEDIRDMVTDRMKYRYNIEQINEDELRDLIFRFGYDLPSFNGYTSTTPYLKRQAQSTIPEIKNKTTNLSYQYIYYVYNLIGFVYPLRFIDGKLYPNKDPNGTTTGPSNILEFDQEDPFILFYVGLIAYPNNPPIPSGLPPLFFDSFDDPNPAARAIFFDGNDQLQFTNHFILSYQFRFIESTEIFASSNTMKSLYENVSQNKRIIECPHYQPRIIFNLDSGGGITTTTYTTEDGLQSSLMETILCNGFTDVSTVAKIQYGTGGFVNPPNTITGVQSIAITQVLSTDYLITNQTTTNLECELLSEEYYIQDFGGSYQFSEIALLNSLDVCVAYARFPSVIFDPRMWNTVYINSTII